MITAERFMSHPPLPLLSEQEMVDRVNQLAYPPTIYSRKWIYGLWYCGTSWQKAVYWGQYPSTFVKRVMAMVGSARLLHLCCGRCRIPGAVNVDNQLLPEVNVLADVEDLPFKRESFDVVLIDPPYSEADAQRYKQKRLLRASKVLQECHRVLMPGGYVFWLDERYPSYRRTNWKLVGLVGIVTGFERRTRVLSILMKRGANLQGDEGGKAMTVLQQPVPPPRAEPIDAPVPEQEIVYAYKDENGEVLFEVIRRGEGRNKTFVQRRPAGNGGYVFDLNGVRRVPYRLNELKGFRTIAVVEGEKDADRLWGLSKPIPATTASGGAAKGKWLPEYSTTLRDVGVERAVIFPDNDVVGRMHARRVARSLLRVGIQVKIVDLPDVAKKGDVSDWLDAGHTVSELLRLARCSKPITLANLGSEDELKKPDAASKGPSYPEVFRHYLNLNPAVVGKVMLNCPFHADDTPSFSLDLDKGVFYCHGGCSEPKGGGPIRFIRKWKKIREGVTMSVASAKSTAEKLSKPVTVQPRHLETRDA